MTLEDAVERLNAEVIMLKCRLELTTLYLEDATSHLDSDAIHNLRESFRNTLRLNLNAQALGLPALKKYLDKMIQDV